MTPKEYVEKTGSQCPHCGSHHIESDGPLEADRGIAWQTVQCSTCKHSWTDEYQLTGFSNLKSDEELK